VVMNGVERAPVGRRRRDFDDARRRDDDARGAG